MADPRAGVFLDNCADIECPDEDRRTPLTFALGSSSEDGRYILAIESYRNSTAAGSGPQCC